VPGTVIGNGGMSGANPVNGVAAMRAELFEPLEITADTAVVITGLVEFVGGGFENVSSFRFGAFMSDSAGSLVDSIPEQSFWNGTEDHSNGYLFVPRSGNNDHAEWANGVMASQGGIVDDPWLETMGPDNFTMGQSNQLPDLAVGSAGVYNFSMSFGPIQNGYMPIHFNLIKDDDSYTYSDVVRDDQATFATTFINSLNFATGNATTTGLFVRDLLIDLGDPIPTVVGIEEVPDAPVPQTYTLDQNYPNPFNPSTTIRFRLPEAQDIKLVVYDVTGRVVSEVVNNRMAAGEYKITFDGQKLASGVYFYRLSAGNFVATRKFILLK
ncbi:MAG: T9SS type A sorting domain-containing protein, partial [Calditrichaeota bacterium]|nr:T9SS type A sorting domain-containing protein [Calditrichota bacterium]